MSEYIRSILRKEINLTFCAERKVWSAALLFVVGFFLFESLYFWSTTDRHISHTLHGLDLVGQLILVIYLAAACYLFLLFIIAAIASVWPIRVLCVTLFSFALFVEYSYQNALGRFTTFYDVVAAVSATGDQRLDSISAYVSVVPLVPVFALVSMAFLVPMRRNSFGLKTFGGIIAISCLFYVHLSYVKPSLFNGEFPNVSFGYFCETASDFVLQDPIQQWTPIKRAEVRQPNLSVTPSNNVILIFDESIRADHLSLNGYARDTTPFLKYLERQHLLLNWEPAAAAATSSHPSYDAFITGTQPDDLEHLSLRELNSRPTIFQYAKSMGYRTIVFDGQMMNYWGGAPDDLNYIDEFDSLSVIDRPDRREDWQTADNKITDESQRKDGLKQWEIDERIAQMVNKIFSASTGNFIFVYKRGCHFPYEKNFPPEESVWKPVYHFKEQYEVPPSEQLQGVINAYDNSLKYNLDEFFKKLAPNYSQLPNNTVIVYTGDHGESFFENGKAGHGGETVGEAEVPLFVLGVPNAGVDTSFRASHHNIFAALLDLMNYPTELRDLQYSISFLKARSTDSVPRFFNPGPGKKIRFD
jgi:glucan phosphoethanolaminetransferase (alkaline phosphatase superfamily)